MSATTKDVVFPILIYGKSGPFRIFNTPDELVERKFYVKHSPGDGKYRVITDDLKSYQVMKFVDLGGVKPLWGIRFGGPLLFQQIVRFDLLLKFDGDKSISDVVDVYCKRLEYGKGVKEEFRKRFLERMKDSEFTISTSYPIWSQLASDVYFEQTGCER